MGIIQYYYTFSQECEASIYRTSTLFIRNNVGMLCTYTNVGKQLLLYARLGFIGLCNVVNNNKLLYVQVTERNENKQHLYALLPHT